MNSILFGFVVGTFFGLYLGNKGFRSGVHTMIDKYILKKNKKVNKNSEDDD